MSERACCRRGLTRDASKVLCEHFVATKAQVDREGCELSWGVQMLSHLLHRRSLLHRFETFSSSEKLFAIRRSIRNLRVPGLHRASESPNKESMTTNAHPQVTNGDLNPAIAFSFDASDAFVC